MNISNITNIDGIYGMGKYAYDVTNGLFFGLLLTAIFIIVAVNLRKMGTEKAVAVASFACLSISTGLTFLNMLSIMVPALFAVILAGSLFYISFINKP